MNQGKLLPVIISFIVLLIIAACGEEEKPQSANQVSENLTSVVTNNEYYPSGAIAEAKARQNEILNPKALKEEAAQFGFLLSLTQSEDGYRKFRNRIFANEALASALRIANEEGVYVYLKEKFYVYTTYIDIDVNATDEEIIEFSIISIPETKARGIAFKALQEEAAQFGLLLWSSDEGKYRKFRNRIFANEALASALRTANEEGVYVYLKEKFYVYTTYIDIDVNATDEEIIEFLLGEQT